MNSNDTEEIGVDAVRKEVRNSPLLQSYIADKDKEPSWDGHIYCYMDSAKKKSSLLGRVPVQVKGKGVKNFSDKSFKYPIELSDLANYQSEDGCLYIVVQIISNDEVQIFYKELLPVDMKVIFKALKKEEQKKYSIEMVALNSEIRSLQSVCSDFLKHRDLQKGKNFIDIETVDTSSTFMTTVSIESKQDPLRYFSENEVYLYYKGDKNQFIPLEEKVRVNMFEDIQMKSFQADSLLIKRQVSRSINNGEVVWYVGENIKIVPSKIIFNPNSNISKQKEDVKFLLKLMSSRRIKVDEFDIEFNLGEDSQNFVNKLIDIEKYLEKITATLTRLEINTEEFGENFQYDDYLKLERLGKTLNGQELIAQTPQFMNLTISEKYYLFFVSEKNGENEIFNVMSPDFFKKIRIYGTIITPDKNTDINIISPFFATPLEDLLKISNFDIDLIINSIKDTINILEQKDQRVSMLSSLNKMILTSLLTYDRTKNKWQLDFAQLLAAFCLENQPEDSICLINLLQCYKRQRTLTDEEKLQVRKIDDSLGTIFSLAKSLLLDNFGDVDFYYSALTYEAKNEFKEQPLFNLKPN
ncbi:hypothetical protein A1A1_13837 [Planococcus antarcticus DSM 14505]|uniref:DUF4365 domain-containing protein n=1 Tax=Planococcus antarcticus DSM 14505 TaxID=1185653 RepID=A0AA87LT91_9BACL|nr:hypothetical protein [Planococcus antarcticus]EIM05907.1 hypothetical protein A1A1_13837 [Planococcus antarcticus DSM 14505]